MYYPAYTACVGQVCIKWESKFLANEDVFVLIMYCGHFQISTVFSTDLSDVPGDYKSLTKHFEILLSKATKDSPLFLFLDGVDQLSPDDGALGMSWLPLSLPPNVKVVLSTSSEVQYRCYPMLQSLMSDRQHNFVMVCVITR